MKSAQSLKRKPRRRPRRLPKIPLRHRRNLLESRRPNGRHQKDLREFFQMVLRCSNPDRKVTTSTIRRGLDVAPLDTSGKGKLLFVKSHILHVPLPDPRARVAIAATCDWLLLNPSTSGVCILKMTEKQAGGKGGAVGGPCRITSRPTCILCRLPCGFLQKVTTELALAVFGLMGNC